MQWTIVIVSVLWCALHIVSTEAQNQDNLSWFTQFFAPKPKQRPDNCPDCMCGVPNTDGLQDPRIVSGQEATAYRYTWMCWLVFRTHNDSFVCGGSLINDLYILTASHCIKTTRENITVSLLRHDLTTEDNSVKRGVAEIIMHENYNNLTLDNDITLLKLDQRIDLSDGHNYSARIRPVCLTPANKSYDDEIATVTGWGYLSQNGPISRKLQQVDLPVVNETSCKKVYGRSLTDNMICAGYTNNGKTACFGDSGGPLHYWNENITAYQEFGVVSWGQRCGTPRIYTIFVKLINYLDWIRDRTTDACTCPEPAPVAPDNSFRFW